jgi:hypothetical protein
LFFLIIINCVSVRVSAAVEDIVAPGSGVSSRVCSAMKLLCLGVGFGAKSVVAVLEVSVLVCDMVSLSLDVVEAMVFPCSRQIRLDVKDGVKGRCDDLTVDQMVYAFLSSYMIFVVGYTAYAFLTLA